MTITLKEVSIYKDSIPQARDVSLVWHNGVRYVAYVDSYPTSGRVYVKAGDGDFVQVDGWAARSVTLVSFNGFLYCIHASRDNGRLFIAKTSTGRLVNDCVPIEGPLTFACMVRAAVHNNQLWLVYPFLVKGTESRELFICNSKSNTWPLDFTVPTRVSNWQGSDVGICSFQGNLVMVHLGGDGIYWAASPTGRFTGDATRIHSWRGNNLSIAASATGQIFIIHSTTDNLFLDAISDLNPNNFKASINPINRHSRKMCLMDNNGTINLAYCDYSTNEVYLVSHQDSNLFPLKPPIFQTTAKSVAIVSDSGGQIYFAYIDNDKYVYFGPKTGSPPPVISGWRGKCLAVAFYKNEFVLVHCNPNNGQVYIAQSNNKVIRPDSAKPMPNVRCNAVSLVVFNDKLFLTCIHNDTNEIFMTTSEDGSFTDSKPLWRLSNWCGLDLSTCVHDGRYCLAFIGLDNSVRWATNRTPDFKDWGVPAINSIPRSETVSVTSSLGYLYIVATSLTQNKRLYFTKDSSMGADDIASIQSLQDWRATSVSLTVKPTDFTVHFAYVSLGDGTIKYVTENPVERPSKEAKLQLMTMYSPNVISAEGEEFLPCAVDHAFKQDKLNRSLNSNMDNNYCLQLNIEKFDNSSLIKSYQFDGHDMFKGHLPSAKIYAFWVEKDAYYDLSYFVYWGYNKGKKVDLTYFGNHVSDWEHVTVRLNKSSWLPHSVYFAKHDNGEIVPWRSVEKTMDTHPNAYSAWGSHGFYSRTGSFDIGISTLTDECSKGIEWHTWYSSLLAYDYFSKTALTPGINYPIWMDTNYQKALSDPNNPDEKLRDPSYPGSGPIWRWGNYKGGQIHIFGVGGKLKATEELATGPTGPADKGDCWNPTKFG